MKILALISLILLTAALREFIQKWDLVACDIPAH